MCIYANKLLLQVSILVKVQAMIRSPAFFVVHGRRDRRNQEMGLVIIKLTQYKANLSKKASTFSSVHKQLQKNQAKWTLDP